jgi:glycosyltransferase involved in cell wall biosynthesis
MTRVLHVYKTYRTESMGGIQQVMHQLVHGTEKYGVRSRVLTLSENPHPRRIQDGEAEVIRYPVDIDAASTPISFKMLADFKSVAKDADIIHYHFPYPMNDLMHFMHRPKKPVVVTYHSDIVKQKKLLKFYSPLMHWFIRRANVIVASSPNYTASSKVLQQYLDKTRVIPFGLVDATPPSQEMLARVKGKIPYERFFLFIGVLRYYKGLHILLEANQQLDYPLVIAGSGPKEAELKSQAEKLGLKNTIFLGQVGDEEKAALLYLCYAFVFPSHLRSEAFGMSLLEAAQAGKPMITTEIGSGMSYINEKNVTGLSVPPADPHALAEALQILWNHRETAQTMGKAAHARFQTLFTAERMAEAYAALYRELS